MKPRSHIEALWGPDDSRFEYEPDTLPDARLDFITPPVPTPFDEIDMEVEGWLADPVIDHPPALRSVGKTKRILDILNQLEKGGIK